MEALINVYSAHDTSTLTRLCVNRQPFLLEWLLFTPTGDTQWEITDPSDPEITHVHAMYPDTPLSRVADTLRRWAKDYKTAYFALY